VTDTSADSAPVSSPAERANEHPVRPEERPGVLRGGATLTLQTHQAQRLVKGRGYTADKPAIIGLIGFANLLRSIWHGARYDDPYADWWLLKVHAALELAEQELVAAEQGIATRFEALGSLEVTAPTSVKPARVALNFSNPYAFRAARLVGLYDALVRRVLSARHVGLLAREEAERALHLGGRQVRRALQSAVGYRFLNVSRGDLEQGTAKAQQAREALGEPPEEVLTGAQRAPFAPRRSSPTPATPPPSTRLHSLPDLT
jgi:integrating conjugative element protein (TIGR03761 family)